MYYSLSQIALFLALILGVSPPVPVKAPINVPVAQTVQGAITTPIQSIKPVITLVLDATTTSMLALTNGDREANGVYPLQENTLLMEAAQQRAEFLCNRPFSHTSDGSSPWDSFHNVGYMYTNAGENLAEDYGTSTEVEAAFMNSPSHRENILNPKYTDYGIAWACRDVVVLFGSKN